MHLCISFRCDYIKNDWGILRQVLGRIRSGYYLARYSNSALFDQLIKNWVQLCISHRRLARNRLRSEDLHLCFIRIAMLRHSNHCRESCPNCTQRRCNNGLVRRAFRPVLLVAVQVINGKICIISYPNEGNGFFARGQFRDTKGMHRSCF
jgi:hypothetical protein